MNIRYMIIMLPQSCGDNISFDTGFQGVKCNTAEHLQEAQQNEAQGVSKKIIKDTFSLQ